MHHKRKGFPNVERRQIMNARTPRFKKGQRGTAYYGPYKKFPNPDPVLRRRVIYTEVRCPHCGAITYSASVCKKPPKPKWCRWCKGHIYYDLRGMPYKKIDY